MVLLRAFALLLAVSSPALAQNSGLVASDRLLGRDSAGVGQVEQLTVGGALSFTDSKGITATGDDIISQLTEGTAIDLSGSTISFDSTEVATTTWGSGSSFVWTFDAGATNPVFTFGSDSVDIAGATLVNISAGSLSASGSLTAATGDVTAGDDLIAGDTLVVNGHTFADGADKLALTLAASTDMFEVNGSVGAIGGSVDVAYGVPGVYFGKESANSNRAIQIVTGGSAAYIDFASASEDFSGRLIVDTSADTMGFLAAGGFAFNNSVDVSGNVLVVDEAYDASGWDANLGVPTKNAVRDKIELLLGTTLPATYQPLDSDLTSWGAVTRAAGFDTFAATPTVANLATLLPDEASGWANLQTTPSSANLAAFITDETGSGVLAFATSPRFTTDIAPATTGGATLGTSSLLWGTSYLGSVELGNASDTSVARSSAGRMTIEGVSVPRSTEVASTAPTSPVEGDCYVNRSNSVRYCWSDTAQAWVERGPSGGEFANGVAVLASGTISSASSLDLKLSSYPQFSTFKLILKDIVPVTDGDDLCIRFSDDSGVSFEADASDYAWAWNRTSFSTGTTVPVAQADEADAQIKLTDNIGNSTNESGSFEITVFSPAASAFTKVKFEGVTRNFTPTDYSIEGGGIVLWASAATDMRVLFLGGNIASGSYTLMGIR